MKAPFLCVIVVALLACGSEGTEPIARDLSNEPDSLYDFSGTAYNILFVGNSLTYFNNLPELVEQEAMESYGVALTTKMIALGNFAIIDHWEGGNVQEEINTGNYDIVIIQQGPSSQAFGRQVLIEYGGKFKELCSANGSALAFYMVWPSLTYYHTFDGVIQSYQDAATINKALLCPVGSVWKQHFDATQDFSYYGSDGFHPSLKGSEVAAEVIVSSLFD